MALFSKNYRVVHASLQKAKSDIEGPVRLKEGSSTPGCQKGLSELVSREWGEIPCAGLYAVSPGPPLAEILGYKGYPGDNYLDCTGKLPILHRMREMISGGTRFHW